MLVVPASKGEFESGFVAQARAGPCVYVLGVLGVCVRAAVVDSRAAEQSNAAAQSRGNNAAVASGLGRAAAAASGVCVQGQTKEHAVLARSFGVEQVIACVHLCACVCACVCMCMCMNARVWACVRHVCVQVVVAVNKLDTVDWDEVCARARVCCWGLCVHLCGSCLCVSVPACVRSCVRALAGVEPPPPHRLWQGRYNEIVEHVKTFLRSAG